MVRPYHAKPGIRFTVKMHDSRYSTIWRHHNMKR